jgi:hypothetical protein
MKTYKAPSTIKGDTVFSYLSSTHGYPVKKLFTPSYIKLAPRISKPLQLIHAFRATVERKFEPTPQDVEYERSCGRTHVRLQKPGMSSSFCVRAGHLSDFVHDGVYWRRTCEGENARCWMDSRINAVYMWRDHADCHPCSCLQPTEVCDKLATGTETIKPVLRTVLNGKLLTLSLDREISPPCGCRWSYHAGRVYIRIDVNGEAPIAILPVWTHLREVLESVGAS